MVAPSGEQYEISNGDHRAVVVSVGGGLRTYTVGGRAVLDGYAEDAACDGARCQTLVPWPNRVQDGKWSWDGHDLQLALTEPEQHNAIHGLVRWMPWTVLERSRSAITVGCTSYPQPGYPWTIEVANMWTLDGEGIVVRTVITNRSDTPAPVAAGFHPYITVGTQHIDEAVLTVPAESLLVTGAQQIPTGSQAVAGTDYDFRSPRSLGDRAIDYAYADLLRSADGRCTMSLATADGRHSVAVWVDEAYPYLEIFTGDALPDPARRRQGLGVEPMSAPPNALATGESLAILGPDESWIGTWGIVVT